MSGSAGPDPATAGSIVEFIAMLRELRETSGLTYRQIQRRAEGLALTLPPSTLATMLGRETLPREELVSTLVRCCGLEPEPWLMAHRRLRQEQRRPAVVPMLAPPEVGPYRFKHPRTAVAMAVIGIMSLLGLSSESYRPQETGALSVVPGPVMIMAAESGLCVSEWGKSDDGFLYLRPCDDNVIPQRTLDARADGYYRIVTQHRLHGAGCMGYQPFYGADRPGDATCEDVKSEVFSLTKVAGPIAGYMVRFVERGTCMAIEEGDSGLGADVVFAECDHGSPNQVFAFLPAFG